MKHKTCISCREQMDIIEIYTCGKLMRKFDVCPKCHEPELRRFSPGALDSRFFLKPEGAYGIG